MDTIHYDIAALILSHLDVESFAKLALSCARTEAICKLYANEYYIGRGYGELARGASGFVARLIKEFTCLCGARSWSIKGRCSCWVSCFSCDRALPRSASHLTLYWTRCCLWSCCRIRCWRCFVTAPLEEFGTWRRLTTYIYAPTLRLDNLLFCRNCVMRYSSNTISNCRPFKSVNPVSKGFVAYTLLTTSPVNAMCGGWDLRCIQPSRQYSKIHDADYISMFLESVRKYDPGHPAIAILK